MKSRTLIFFISVFFVLSVISCIKEQRIMDYDITKYKWQVLKIRDANNSVFSKANEVYIMEFLNNEQFELSLDVNRCYGIYKIGDNKAFYAKSIGCTEICCDSKFAEDLTAVFEDAEEYYTTENELHISGKGEIIFVKYTE